MSPEHNIPGNWRLRKIRYQLLGEVCPHCDAKIFPPRDICPECGLYVQALSTLLSYDQPPKTGTKKDQNPKNV